VAQQEQSTAVSQFILRWLSAGTNSRSHEREMLMNMSLVSRAALVFFVVLSAAARADVLVSNLSEPSSDRSPIGNNPNPADPPEGPGAPWYWGAQSFLPDNNSYSLISIEAIVGDGSSSPAPVVVAELRNDSAGLVGSLITTLTAPSVSGAQSARTFLPDNPVTLLANTPYWFVLGSQAPGDGTYFWSYALGNGAVGPGSFANYNYSEDSGATWANFGSDNPLYLQVNVRAVPEPCSSSLLLIGSVGMLRRCRRRDRRVWLPAPLRKNP
jgi:hypothetical protein